MGGYKPIDGNILVRRMVEKFIKVFKNLANLGRKEN